MAKRGFLARHGIVRNAIREDLLYFAIPALFVFSAGLAVSVWDGFDGMVGTIWDLVRHPGNLYLLSILNIVGLALFVIGFTILLVAHLTLRLFHSSTLVIREINSLRTASTASRDIQSIWESS